MCMSGGVAQVTDGNSEFLMERMKRQRAAEDASLTFLFSIHIKKVNLHLTTLMQLARIKLTSGNCSYVFMSVFFLSYISFMSVLARTDVV